MRWTELLWERHQTNTREEGRTREVLDVFEGPRRALEAARGTPALPALGASAVKAPHKEKGTG